MALEDGEIGWFSPDPRGIIPLESGGFHLPHGLKRSLKKNLFELRMNTAFEAVIRACARRAETWISEEIITKHAGTVRIKSRTREKSWTSFSVFFPVNGLGHAQGEPHPVL